MTDGPSLPAGQVLVRSLASAKDRRVFRELPKRLYAQDPYFVPPLDMEVDGFLNQGKHPFYRDAEAEFFLAFENDRCVGRIAAIQNHAHNRYHDDRVGFFGFFEAEPRADVVSALLLSAEEWLSAKGLTSIRGPLSPSSNYVSGLLAGGDPGPPCLMMPYNPSTYLSLLEANGYEKAMDLFAYYLDEHMIDLVRWHRLAAKLAQRAGVTFRNFDMSRWKSEVELIVEIYHDAWAKNWGFVPMNAGEIEQMNRELKPTLLPFMGAFLEKDGREIGFWMGLLDFNRVLIDLNGRLFPTGLFKLLAAKSRLDFMRLLLMGVRQEWQGHGLDALLYNHSITECIPRGVWRCEASWILETNLPMINAMERAGGRHYRTYRIFEKPLR